MKATLAFDGLSGGPVLNATENFSCHASVLKIKEARDSSECFSFKLVTIEDICMEMLALDASRATQSDGMPTRIIKNNPIFFVTFFKQTLITLLKQVLFQSN